MVSPYLVPGPGETIVNATGRTLDKNKFKLMLKEYYQLRGWDEETGLPRSETLINLGMDDLEPAFQRQGTVLKKKTK